MLARKRNHFTHQTVGRGGDSLVILRREIICSLEVGCAHALLD